MSSRFLLSFACCLLAASFFAAWARGGVDLPLGWPIVTSHSAREYDSHAQNHGVAVNAEGLVYVANARGLLEYDGEGWRRIVEDLREEVFGVAVGLGGRIFIGTFDRFGEVKPRLDGSFEFVSFHEQVPEAYRGDQLYRGVRVSGDKVVFSTHRAVYVWSVSTERLERVEEGLDNRSVVFALGADIFSTATGAPLRRLGADGWVPVAGTERFEGEDQRVLRAGVSEEGVAYLVTGDSGVYRFDGRTVELFSADPVYYSDWRNARAVLPLRGGGLVVGTLKSGVFVFGRDGRLRQRVEKRSGLSDDRADALVEDGFGGVWIAQGKGLSRAQLGSPISCYGPAHGLEGAVHFVEEHRGRLFVGTSMGLFVAESVGGAARFRAIEGMPETKGLLEVEDGLMAGAVDALYLIRGDVSELIVGGLDSSYLYSPSRRPEYVVAAGYAGLSVLVRRDGVWSVVGGGPVVDKPVHGIAESSSGELWLKSGAAVTRRVRWLPGDVFEVDTFGLEHGLPKGWISPLSVAGRMVFTTADGRLNRFEEAENRFVPETEYSYFPGSEVSGFLEHVRDGEGRDWVARSAGRGVLVPKPAGDYLLGMQFLGSTVDARASAVYVEESGTAWLGSYDGLTRWDPALGGTLPREFSTLIRRVEDMNTGVALLGGAFTGESAPRIELGSGASLRVQLASSLGVSPEATLYQIYLKGYDAKPSAPSGDATREFTNLSPGKYRLEAMTFDSRGRPGRAAYFDFAVVAPFYRTGWAWLGYGLLGLGLLLAALRWRERALNRVNSQLRNLVALRTGELARQSEALAERNRELETKNDELRALALRASDVAEAKTRFLAMMSHEIRTPMNGVKGMCSLMNRTELSLEQAEYLESIKVSSDSLLAIIDDILNYTRIEDGKLELEAIDFDLLESVEGVVSLLGPQAIDKGLEICLLISPGVARWRVGDPTRLRQVLMNLVGNAIKFTEAGSVSILVDTERRGNDALVRIEVVDTGVGVEASKHETIFEPFFQADVSNVRRFGGTGLGLSICKHIVERMGGTIELSSEPMHGARFVVLAPCPLAEREEALWPGAEALAGKRAALYCVEDCSRELVASYLRDWGVSVDFHDTASLLLAESNNGATPDLAVIEHKLVSCAGVELASRYLALEESGYSPPVLLLVSRNTDTMRAEVGALGSVSAMSKPVLPTRLLREVLALTESEGAAPTGAGARARGASVRWIEPPADYRDLRVLVAEDNHLNQDVVVRLLEGMGVRVALAKNGEEAVSLYFDGVFDLVLMDVQMPVLDGIQATKKLFELRTAVHEPFVYGLSAGVLREERAKCIDSGMAGFIRKPFEISDLTGALDAARERKRVGAE